jgi:hypothetical protein
MKVHQPAIRAQFRAHLQWIEEAFADGREYLMGAAPSVADFALYHPLWFLRGNVKEPDLMEGAQATKAWHDRMSGFGHGTSTLLEAKTALYIAREANPKPAAPSRGRDPSGCKPGDKVIVNANDTGRDPIGGELLSIDEQRIVIRRQHPELRELHQHFPRVGFDVTAA